MTGRLKKNRVGVGKIKKKNQKILTTIIVGTQKMFISKINALESYVHLHNIQVFTYPINDLHIRILLNLSDN